MAITLSDLEAFHRFALARVSGGPQKDLTFDDLFIEWDSVRNRDEINSVIDLGIADVNGGRTRNVREFNEVVREQYNIDK